MATAAALSVRVSANIGDFEKQMSSLERSLDRTGSRMQSVGAKLTTGLTLPIIAVAGGAMKAAADFEEAFSGVAKTVDGVANNKGQLTAFGKELQQQFRDMAKTIPITVNELAKIGEAAGAMGIPKQKIAEFTKTIAMLAATTDLTSDQAAMSVGKIQGIYGKLGEDTDRFGSSLVALGNAGNSFESTIVRAAERMAAFGVQAKISQDQLLGWASAISDISPGGNIELTTTAWNKLVSVMDKAVDLGGGKLDSFAKVASLGGQQFTSASFAELFNKDSSSALLAFVQGLGQVEAKGGNVTKVLEDMGLKTSGVQLTLKALAATSGDVGRQLALSREEWKKNTAMQEEFSKKSATTISQLKILFNQLYDVGIQLGQTLIPAFMRLRPAIESAIGVLVTLVDWFSRLPESLQLVVIGFFGVLAAIGPVVFAIGTVVKGFAGLAGAAGLGAKGMLAAFGTTTGVIAALAGIAYGLNKVAEAWRNAANAYAQGGWRAVAGELGRNVNDDSKSFFKDWRVDQQPNRRRGGAAPAGVISPGALAGGAAAARARDELKNMASGVSSAFSLGGDDGKAASKAADKAAEAWQKFKDDMSGVTAVKEAEKVMRALGEGTGIAADQQERFNRILREGIDAMLGLKMAVPRDMFDQWLRGALPKVQDGIKRIGEPMPGQAIKPMNATDALLAGYANTVPVGSSIAGIGQDVTSRVTQMPAAPGFLSQAFGSMKDFGANLSSTVMSALTGGGNVGGAVGGMLGGSIFGQLGGMLAGKMAGSGIGSMIGGALGSVLPGIGNIIGSMIGPLIGKLGGALSKMFGRGDDGDKERDAFQDQFGGFNKLGAELSKLGAEGERLFQALQKADSGKEVQAAADQITKALEAHAKAIEGITEGVNARSKNITGQADLDVVGAGASAALGLMIQQGKSAIEAFSALTPAITAMRDALAAGNLTASESVARMLEIGAVLDANKIQFENIAASGQILSAMLQGNIRDAGLFGAVAGDIGTQIQAVIDKGVPMAQVFALAQPQLQAIWEAQQKWGFAVDETTAALLAEAEAQGFVGAQMQSVNQQILNVLIAIGNVLGADIPAALGALPGHAQNAANGMQQAFDGIKGPDLGGGGWQPGDVVPSPVYGANVAMANGGIVRRPTVALIGEAGPEAVIPLRHSSVRGGSSGGGGDVYLDGELVGRVLLPAIVAESQRLGVS